MSRGREGRERTEKGKGGEGVDRERQGRGGVGKERGKGCIMTVGDGCP